MSITCCDDYQNFKILDSDWLRSGPICSGNLTSCSDIWIFNIAEAARDILENFGNITRWNNFHISGQPARLAVYSTGQITILRV